MKNLLKINKKTVFQIIACWLGIASLVACSPPNAEPTISQIQNPSKLILVTDTAETSTTVVVNPDDGLDFCASNAPDATFSASVDGDIDFTLVHTGDNKGSHDSAAENTYGQEMMGRTASVLAAREILFRACEISRNLNLDKDQGVDIFKYAVEQSAQILLKELENTTVSVTETLTDTRNQTSSSDQTTSREVASPDTNVIDDVGSAGDTESSTDSDTTTEPDTSWDS